MQNAQEIYNRLSQNRRKAADIRKQLKDEYMSVDEYVDLMEQRKQLTSSMKVLKEAVNARHPELVTSLEDLKIDIASDKELLSDILLTGMMRGESVELENEYHQEVLPIFTVSLKQA